MQRDKLYTCNQLACCLANRDLIVSVITYYNQGLVSSTFWRLMSSACQLQRVAYVRVMAADLCNLCNTS